jgi:outer membrane receptor for ferric coprogen and ferric-rhodotorulic acid
MIVILITLFGRQPKKKLKDLLCSFPQSGKTAEEWARNNEQKAQRFAEHLEHIFQPHGSQKEKEMITEETVQENEEIKLVTTTEIKNEIKKQHKP